jgi:hypothetical protein
MEERHMKLISKTLPWVVFLAILFGAGPAVAQDGADQEEGETQDEAQDDEQSGSSLQRGNRMEFDARLIRGESAGSGAVFLFDRGQRPLPSMIERRRSFLRGTVDSALGQRWAKQFEQARDEQSDSD